MISIRYLLAIILYALLLPLHAEEDLEKIRYEINRHIPQSGIDELIALEYEGFYGLVANGEVLYYHHPTQVLFSGQMIDIKEKNNISNQVKSQLFSHMFPRLPLDKAIQFRNGTGKRQAVFFTDPYCRYCDKMEENLRLLKDTTVYILPVSFLGANSKETIEKIYCSLNLEKAWTEWHNSHSITNSNTSCNGTASFPYQFHEWSQKIGIRGVPALFLPTGEVITGLIPEDKITKLLEQQQ